jgi:hypothetical protein
MTYSIRKHGEKMLEEALTHDEEQTRVPIDLTKEIIISRYELPRDCYVITHIQSGTQIEFDASFDPLRVIIAGSHLLPEIADESVITDDIDPDNPLDVFVQNVMEDSLKDLIHGVLQQR